MQLSSDALQLIRQREGLVLTAYRDARGIWTIGYGHTHGVHPGDECSDEQAEMWLYQDACNVAETLAGYIPAGTLNQHQFDACGCLAYNIGTGAFYGSTLLHLLLQNQLPAAAQQFDRWVYATTAHGPEILPGLVTRREQERAMFETGWSKVPAGVDGTASCPVCGALWAAWADGTVHKVKIASAVACGHCLGVQREPSGDRLLCFAKIA